MTATRLSTSLQEKAHDGPAHWLKIEAPEDGSFRVTNSRNNFSSTYAASGK
jgi:hypothetical protein